MNLDFYLSGKNQIHKHTQFSKKKLRHTSMRMNGLEQIVLGVYFLYIEQTETKKKKNDFH